MGSRCVGDALEITRPRRSRNPASITSKTPESGLEIRADIEWWMVAGCGDSERVLSSCLRGCESIQHVRPKGVAHRQCRVVEVIGRVVSQAELLHHST